MGVTTTDVWCILTTNILTHFRSPPPPPTLSAYKNKRCDLPTTSCQSHLIKFTWISYLLIKTLKHWSVRFLCLTKLYFFLFCSSWHNLVGIKITVRLHLLNRLFKCIQNSTCALLVHWVFFCNIAKDLAISTVQAFFSFQRGIRIIFMSNLQ